MSKAWAGALAAMALLGRGAAAQGTDDCFPGPDSHEAHTMAIFDVPLAFSGAAAPARQPRGRLHIGIEGSLVPNVNRETAIPTSCRPTKLRPENTDLMFAAPRARISYALPAGFDLEAAWTPPVRISQVRANLVAVALSRTTVLNSRAALKVRAHGSFGIIKAPITCDDAALQDASSECYQGTRSDDEFHPNVYGLEAAIGWALGGSVRPYIGAGYNRLSPRFRVNFTNQFGVVDRRRVSVDMNRGVLFAGATWRATTALELTGEVYSAPTDAVTARVVARVRLGAITGADR